MAEKKEGEGHEKNGTNGTNGTSYPKEYVITAAQASYHEKWDKESESYLPVRNGAIAPIHENLIEGLDKYCKIHNAELIILKMAGKDASEDIMHKTVAERPELFFGNKALNSNIKICDMVVPPQNVDPSTGRLRFAQKDTTLIYGHPKQRLRAVPASNSKLPRLLLTTGAVTQPNYNRSNHRGDVAFRDHVYGGIVVEVIDNVCYNARFLRAQRDGQFVDLGLKYNGNKKPTPSKVEALVLGDIHSGDEDEMTMEANREMIEFFKPRRLILHDLFNGHSVNPHEKDNLISRVREYDNGRLSLESEFNDCSNILQNLSGEMGKGQVYVVASNHPYFLIRYLESGEILEDPWNVKFALDLARKMCDGVDPLEAGLRMVGDIPSNVTFLKLRDDLKIWGYQLASHGHKGLSGSKTSNAISREIAHGKSITGHSHTPEVFRNTYIVGTSSRLDLEYTSGSATSWMAANAVLYEGGTVQLIPIIRGKWKPKGTI